jgi:hypothetical protein
MSRRFAKVKRSFTLLDVTSANFAVSMGKSAMRQPATGLKARAAAFADSVLPSRSFHV